MHNEGAQRHHAGAPGPLLYLKPRGDRRVPAAGLCRSARQALPLSRAASPGGALPAAPSLLVLSGKGSRELQPRPRGAAAGGGGDARRPGPREGGQQRPDAEAPPLGPGGARCEGPRSRRWRRPTRSSAEPGTEERRAQRIRSSRGPCTRGAARSCSPAAAPRPAAPRGCTERLPPSAAGECSRVEERGRVSAAVAVPGAGSSHHSPVAARARA